MPDRDKKSQSVGSYGGVFLLSIAQQTRNGSQQFRHVRRFLDSSIGPIFSPVGKKIVKPANHHTCRPAMLPICNANQFETRIWLLQAKVGYEQVKGELRKVLLRGVSRLGSLYFETLRLQDQTEGDKDIRFVVNQQSSSVHGNPGLIGLGRRND